MLVKRLRYYLVVPLFLLGWMGVRMIAADGSPGPFHDVAGEYCFGDGLGVNCNLTLSGRGKFTFEWRGCLGTYDKNNGSASIKDGVIHIEPKKANIQGGFRGTPTEFFPVRWGARMYLIPTNEIVAFCSDVNQVTEPRQGIWGRYYLRRDDWNQPVAGKPAVPERWAKYFLSQPVRGKITQLIGKQEAWLDMGTEAGILGGMILTAQGHGKLMFSQVRVEVVEKARCRIKCEWKDSELAAGQTVSSRFYEQTANAK